MAGKSGYETIPDVEEGGGDAKLTLKQTYPEANETELQLLGLLDETTAASDSASILDVSIPEVSAEDVGVSRSSSFCGALISPTFVALLSFAAALFVEESPFDFSLQVFPYVAAFFIFVASIPSIDGRIMKQMSFVFASMTMAEDGVYGAMDGVTHTVDDKVSTVQAKLGDVVEPWKVEVKKATKIEKRLKQLDPKFEIPDPTLVEKELDGATNQVADQVDMIKKSMDVASMIPVKLTSPGAFYNRVVLPILMLCCIFQLLTAFLIVFFLGGNEVELVATRRQLWLFLFDDDDDDFITGAVTETNELVNMDEVDVDAADFLQATSEEASVLYKATAIRVEAELTLVYVVGACFGLAIIQIALVYILTRPSAISDMVNSANEEVAASASRTLREQGVGNLCSDILGTRMSRIKNKIWGMIQAMIQLETLVTKLSTLPSTAKMVSSGSETAKRLASSKKLESSQKAGFGSFFGLGGKR